MTLVFDKCCGCIELRTGCLIIGYLNLIGNIVAIIFDFLVIGVAKAASSDTSGKLTPEQKQVAFILFVITTILLLFLFLFLAFTIVLLVGIHQEKRGHVKAYLIYTTFFIVVYIILFLAGFSGTVNVGKVFQDLFSILLSIYFLLCIRSHYIKMGDSSMRPAIYNTA